MSLLTPPSTSHRREKENHSLSTLPASSSSRVVWAQTSQIHDLAVSPKRPPTTASATKSRPAKSILKKRSPILIFPPAEPQREVTPEPNDPLVDLMYLEGPVAKILSATENLRELVEAYSVLAARLRTSVVPSTDVDASWPLFQPLRKNKAAFVDAVVRDLARALVDPATVFPKTEPDHGDDTHEWEEEREKMAVLLPSPQNTPVKTPEGEKKKKKDGMTADQVKYARDLCTTCHSVLRLLGLVFTLPALQNVFTESDLHQMLTATLAIPHADELPTPNARKTYALAIWLIQTQRLPESVMVRAADRIAYALRRGIEGELGKEGKKGSVSDGLKAVYDLSTYLPHIFIPAFTPLLPALLSNLLATTLPLRVQACHALGGFVLGLLVCDSTSKERHDSEVDRTRIAITVTEFLTRPPLPSTPRKSPFSSPTKLSSPLKPSMNLASPGKQDAPIVRTLRTTLNASSPSHAAHGPVWGLCVLAGLIVLLGGCVTETGLEGGKVGRIVSSLAALGMAHSRSSVRALACLMWRGIGWGWFVATGEGRAKAGVAAWWKVVLGNVELSTGTSIVGGLVNAASQEEEDDAEDEKEGMMRWDAGDLLRGAVSVLEVMVKKDDKTCKEAIDSLKQLVGAGKYRSSPDRHETQEDDEDSYENEDPNSWHPSSLIPHALFASIPHLMAVEFTSLSKALHPIFADRLVLRDVRALRRTEIMRGWGCTEPTPQPLTAPQKAPMWEGLVGVWRACLGEVAEFGDTHGVEIPRENDLVIVWEGLVGMGVGYFQDGGDDETTLNFVARTVDILVELLQDSSLELVPVSKLIAVTSSSASPEKKSTKLKAMKPKGGFKKSPEVPVLNLRTNKPDRPAPNSPRSPLAPGTVSNPNAVQKLRIVRRLWTVLRTLVPTSFLSTAAERMVACLMKGMEEFTDSSDSVLSVFSAHFGLDRDGEELENEEALVLWAELCVDVLVVCDVDALREFWGYVGRGAVDEGTWKWNWGVKECILVWGVFGERWGVEKEEGWEGLVCLLGVPFMDANSWDLSKEDVTRWQALLEHAVAKALDYGVDAITVLDTLVTSIAQHNAPISSSPSLIHSIEAPRWSSSGRTATRLVELLLSYLAPHLADTQEMSEGLVDFVSETLREAYPPTPRDTPVYLWAARAVMQLIEHCPETHIVAVLTSISDGLGIWIGDECKAWTVQELEYDILPLYQHVLLRIQSLPLGLETLQTFAALIESPFSGREDMPSPAVDAFRDFWEIAYVRMEQPKEGWPAEICNCLRVAMGIATPAIFDNGKELLVPHPKLAAAFCPSPSPALSTSSIEAIVSNSPRPSTPTPSTPSTFTSVSCTSTPSRPGSPVRSSSIPFPSRSPVGSPQRTPGTPTYTPRSAHRSLLSSKRRKLGDGDKENRSPAIALPIRSVEERISMRTAEDRAWVTKPFMLGKRRFEEEELDEDQPSPLKKGKKLDLFSDDSEDELDVNTDLVATSSIVEDVFTSKFFSPFKTTSSVDLFLFTPPKKRKRVFMEAVEVPTLREVYTRLKCTTSLESLRATPSSLFPSARHMCSVTREPASTRILASDGSSRKRRRASAEDIFSSSPLHPLEAPRSDSFSLTPVKTWNSPDFPSSDDDPHFGQVTPHRIISPKLRRAQGTHFEDPPSDDSTILASPSRDLAERRLQRLGSLNGLPKPVPFAV
ncbi:hypothetical protein BDZ94DRAFT_1253254 [Collybia nuda]|uniref:Telomere-associated protein Rif1 N-terminal domain-containing protein n=1 Tax=Collybia nuda TaxID=64659 RepID=A0A9P6CGY2_9AGAR|nr:hypothetical protein BDZ94DRAFT_1253254 [Collybia nuda]